MLFNSISLALCSLLGFFGIASALSSGLPDKYTVVAVQWDLPTSLNDPNSATVTVFGTIQQAVAQMESKYPGWNATFQNQPSSESTVSATTQYDRSYYLCGEPWVKTGWLAVKDGIAYLRKVKTAAPKNGPGPNNCGRVSCGYNAAIYWCNDVFYKDKWNVIVTRNEC
ncbi:hypothetical protein QBC40DRAFT_298243 [Triangularia verruculosa]|uniref:Uncharacterized protein n=1 Tax=Triangularia verruculosa TaxID=2587418 RepID=A0AAN6XHI0_9PEZI|nr:hypothetical protein QBC40DRAFT_298243 [Triangularia verruculosa]